MDLRTVEQKLRNAVSANIIIDDTRITTPMCVSIGGALLVAANDRMQKVTILEIPISTSDRATTITIEGTVKTLDKTDPEYLRFQSFFPDNDTSVVAIAPARCELSENGETEVATYTFEKPRLLEAFSIDIEHRMVEHMNDDHVDAIVEYCNYKSIPCQESEPKMLSVDRLGFYVYADRGPARINFDERCEEPIDVRKALVELAKQARTANGTAA